MSLAVQATWGSLEGSTPGGHFSPSVGVADLYAGRGTPLLCSDREVYNKGTGTKVNRVTPVGTLWGAENRSDLGVGDHSLGVTQADMINMSTHSLIGSGHSSGESHVREQ